MTNCPMCGAFLAGVPPPPPSGWQPIETVPQDKRWVVVCDDVENYAIYRFGPGLIDSAPDDPTWTHWMPLPAPPRDQEPT